VPNAPAPTITTRTLFFMREDCNRVGRYFHLLDIMPLMKKVPVIFLFNSPIASGCDYVTQTMRLVAKKHPSLGLALGDIIFLPKLFTEREPWVVRSLRGAIIIRPISVLPGVRFRWVRMATYIVYALFLSLFMGLRYFGSKRVVWFFEPFHLPPLLRIFQSYVSIYDCVDYYPGFSEAAEREHVMLMRRATYVFANSLPLLDQLKKMRKDVRAVPLGFSDRLFTTSSSTVEQSKNIFTVGFVGSISDRIDFPLLQHVVAALPRVCFVFVGAKEVGVFGRKDNVERSFDLLLKHKNVRWINGVAKERVPSVLQGIDIGIIPYREHKLFNRYSFPMKTLEYFSVGRPVVATDIVALRQYEALGLLTIARTPDAFVQAIRSLYATGWDPSHQKRQRQHAKKHTWAKKINAIVSVIQ